MSLAEGRYAAVAADPDRVERVPLVLVRRDGSTFQAEVSMTGVTEGDVFVGAQGTVRDVSERERLADELRRSEERYRYLVQNAPDIVWSIGADAKLNFLSDATERLTGFRPDELLGKHFGAIVHESSRDVTQIDWSDALNVPSQELRGRINLLHRDGSPVPAEFIAVASVHADGQFAGANGSVRDMRERDRLERELRGSQERYKTLASSLAGPRLRHGRGRPLHVPLGPRRVDARLGPHESLGRSFRDYVAPGWETAAGPFEAMLADPRRYRVRGSISSAATGAWSRSRSTSSGSFEDGRLEAIHGVARDVSERERLQRDLQRSEERYRFLVEQSPDIVFATDAEGRFTFLSEAIEGMTDFRRTSSSASTSRSSSSHRPWRSRPTAGRRPSTSPATEVQADLILAAGTVARRRSTSGPSGVSVDGSFTGIQGATRDVSHQVRLEGELRRQAGELAAGEERAHLARELHDSVTQALFSMTLVSRSVELLLDRDRGGGARAARPAARPPARGPRRDARPHLRAAAGQPGAGRPRPRAQDPQRGAPGPDRPADRGRERPRRPAAARRRGRPLPDRPGGAPQRGQARRGAPGLPRDRGADGGIHLRVQDDGKGFDPGRVPDGHLGLAGMRARTERMGARFEVTSKPGAGTTIEVDITAAAIAAMATSAAMVDGRPRSVPAESASIRDD